MGLGGPAPVRQKAENPSLPVGDGSQRAAIGIWIGLAEARHYGPGTEIHGTVICA